jgi:hypothetical protein
LFKKVYVTVPPPVFKAVAVIVAEFPKQKDVEVEVMLTVGVLLDEIVRVITFDVAEVVDKQVPDCTEISQLTCTPFVGFTRVYELIVPF